MRISWSRFVRRIAAVLLIGGSTVLSSAMCYAFNAFDSAADPVYLDGWQDGDNGGTGFTPWDFSSSLTYNGIYYGQYTMSTFHAIDNGLQGGTHYSNPFNNIGRAWDLGISPTSNGVPRAGRGFSPLQIGQTLEVVFDNPTTRQFFKGYTISLHGGTGGVDGNIGYQGYPCNPPAMPVKKMDLGTFEYFTNGAWGIGDSAGVSTGVLDTDTAAAGAVFTVERTGLETYDVKLHPLGGGPDFVAMGRTFANAGAEVDWIQFQIYNTTTDTAAPPTTATDFYIKSLKITSAAIPGDVNFDGYVDIFDVNFVSAHWSDMGAPGIPGDANEDGKVDIFDINLISSNWAPNPGGAAAVPEPATWLGAVLGVLGLGLAKICRLARRST